MAMDGSRLDDAKGIVVVKLGEGDDCRYAVCQRMTTVGGDHRLPGSRHTVAELVRSQGLLAGVLSDDDCEGFREMAFWSQSGRNVNIIIK